MCNSLISQHLQHIPANSLTGEGDKYGGGWSHTQCGDPPPQDIIMSTYNYVNMQRKLCCMSFKLSDAENLIYSFFGK